MNRREAILSTGSMFISASIGALACGGTNASAQRAFAPPAGGGTTNPTGAAAVHEAARSCVVKGEACMAHCLSLMAAGDASMGPCGKASYEMYKVMLGLVTAAASQSKHLPALAKAAMEFCRDCEVECRKHAEHHIVCKECMEACARTIAACEKLTA